MLTEESLLKKDNIKSQLKKKPAEMEFYFKRRISILKGNVKHLVKRSHAWNLIFNELVFMKKNTEIKKALKIALHVLEQDTQRLRKVLNIKTVILILLLSTPVFAQPVVITNEGYDYLNEVCDAVFHAEGGKDATYKYGIRSIKYKSEKESRRICITSFSNNVQRYFKDGCWRSISYLRFARDRFAPLQAENDPGRLNKYWLKNVKWFFRSSKGDKMKLTKEQAVEQYLKYRPQTKRTIENIMN